MRTVVSWVILAHACVWPLGEFNEPRSPSENILPTFSSEDGF